MMHQDLVYELMALDRVDEAIAQYDRQSGTLEQGSLRTPAMALALALRGRVREATEVLEAARSAAAPEDRSIALEAEMVIAIREKRPAEEIESLARRAIEESEEAIFAHRVLGHRAEATRRLDEALGHHKAAHQAAPQSQRSMRDYARTLVLTRQADEALTIIRKMRPSLRREVYRMWALWRKPARVFLAGIVLLLTLACAASPVVLWGVVGFGVLFALLGVRWGDVLVFGVGTRLEVMALAGWLLAEILQRTSMG